MGQEEAISPTAHRFGSLVGALRRAAEQQVAGVSEHRASVLQTTPRGTRPRPSGNMVSLTSSESDDSD